MFIRIISSVLSNQNSSLIFGPSFMMRKVCDTNNS